MNRFECQCKLIVLNKLAEDNMGITYRRQGIAKELLDRVVNEAREYGCGTVQITVYL